MIISQIQAESLSVEDSSYPLFIQPLQESERIVPELAYRLVHRESGLQVPGQFTKQEAESIRTVTQNWDWSVDKHRKPACATRLLHFLEQLCSSPSDNQEVAV
jgi:hypothetical protein